MRLAATTWCPLATWLFAASIAVQPAHVLAQEPAKKPSAAQPLKRYGLGELIGLAQHSYPGVAAAAYAVEAMRQQLFRATWAWLPSGQVEGLFAPSPEIECFDAAGNRSEVNCVRTSTTNLNSFRINGVFGRIEAKVGMPLYTFGKLSSAKRAARAGVEAREAQQRGSELDVALNVVRAYWGVKLAREILFTIEEGRSHLVDAQKRLAEQIETGEGEATVTDELRLKTAAAEVDARSIEATQGERFALAALATLTGIEANALELDPGPIEPSKATVQPLDAYLALAHRQRPEVKALAAGERASVALADLAKASFFPNLLFVAMFGVGGATNIDDPKNIFYSDPFNFMSAGFGLALRWDLQPAQHYAQFKAARAEVDRFGAQRREALAGIDLEIRKTYLDLQQAQEQLEVAQRGQKAARSWLVATSQNLAAGLAQPKDLVDALVAFFQLKLRYLRAMYDLNVGWSQLDRAIGSSL